MATAAMSAANTAAIMVNIFDGSRQLIGTGVKNLLLRIIDGNQKELLSKFLSGATFQFQVPFYDNLGDFYTVLASADDYKQAGFTPIHVGPTVPQTVDLMLLPSVSDSAMQDGRRSNKRTLKSMQFWRAERRRLTRRPAMRI